MTSNILFYIFIIIFIIVLFGLIVRYVCIKKLDTDSDSETDELSSEDSVVLDVYSSCSICLGILVIEHNNCVELSCKHIIHKKCLEKFKKSKLEFNCPICRDPIRGYTKINR